IFPYPNHKKSPNRCYHQCYSLPKLPAEANRTTCLVSRLSWWNGIHPSSTALLPPVSKLRISYSGNPDRPSSPPIDNDRQRMFAREPKKNLKAQSLHRIHCL